MEPLSYLPIENARFDEILAKQAKEGFMRERGQFFGQKRRLGHEKHRIT
jgi:hypothetical protein